MRFLPIILLSLSSCCASPRWKNCGMDDMALALPAMCQRTEYKLFEQLVDGRPDYYYVLINRNETLLNKKAKKLPFLVDNLGLWKVPYSTVLYLTGHVLKFLPYQTNVDLDYDTLRRFIESKRPGHTVALVHEDEVLLNGEWTPMHFDHMRIWVTPKARGLHLVKRAA